MIMKKKLMKKIKKIELKKRISKILKYLNKNKKNILNTIILILPFIIMDLFTRINNNVDFYKFYYLTPNLFTILYIILFYQLFKCLKGWIGKAVYSLIFIVYFCFFIVNNVYFSITGNFFDFVLL